jgi:hypothetical protein
MERVKFCVANYLALPAALACSLALVACADKVTSATNAGQNATNTAVLLAAQTLTGAEQLATAYVQAPGSNPTIDAKLKGDAKAADAVLQKAAAGAAGVDAVFTAIAALVKDMPAASAATPAQ